MIASYFASDPESESESEPTRSPESESESEIATTTPHPCWHGSYIHAEGGGGTPDIGGAVRERET